MGPLGVEKGFDTGPPHVGAGSPEFVWVCTSVGLFGRGPLHVRSSPPEGAGVCMTISHACCIAPAVKGLHDFRSVSSGSRPASLPSQP